MSLLEVRDLALSFPTPSGRVRALDGVSFELEAGRTLALVGESGSGKSAACLALLGLSAPGACVEGGSLCWRGAERLPLGLRGELGRSVGVVFQDPLSALNPRLSVGAQLAEVLQVHRNLPRRAAWARAARALFEVGLDVPEERLRSLPSELSGGQRQRVLIAMALLNDPELLVADEPTTALDPSVAAEILALFAELRARRGLAILIVTHDFGVVARLAHEVAVMYAGRVVERASTQQILVAPRHPYTRGLLDCLPRLDGPVLARLPSLAGQTPSLAERPAGCAFAPRCVLAEPRCRAGRVPLEPCGENAPHSSACLRWRELVP
jgi:oligopeptide/dipeptide ABC transporter ATP-binding protein